MKILWLVLLVVASLWWVRSCTAGYRAYDSPLSHEPSTQEAGNR